MNAPDRNALRKRGASDPRTAAQAPRVAFVNRFYFPDESATAQLLTDLAEHLAAMGWRVSVVTSDRRYDDPKARLPARETIAGVEVLRVAMSGFGRARLLGRGVDYATFHLGAFLALLRAIRPGDLVVAKTDPPLISLAAGLAAAWRGGRLVNWTQDLFPEVATAAGLKGFGLAAPARALRDLAFRRAALNVALGRRMAERIAAAGASPDRVRVVANWVDDAAIRPIERRGHPLRARWGLADRFVVGYSGNMGRVHDFATIRALALALKDEPGIDLVFVGGGLHRRGLERDLAAAGCGRVRFLPYQPREALAASLTAIDLHLVSLLPQYEGLVLPSKLYGVLAAGRPVLFIGDPEGEVGRLIAEQGCGFTVRPGEAAAAADFVRGLARDPARWAELGHRARALSDRQFGRVRALAAWSALLAGLAAENQAPTSPGPVPRHRGQAAGEP